MRSNFGRFDVDYLMEEATGIPELPRINMRPDS